MEYGNQTCARRRGRSKSAPVVPILIADRNFPYQIYFLAQLLTVEPHVRGQRRILARFLVPTQKCERQRPIPIGDGIYGVVLDSFGVSADHYQRVLVVLASRLAFLKSAG